MNLIFITDEKHASQLNFVSLIQIMKDGESKITHCESRKINQLYNNFLKNNEVLENKKLNFSPV